MFKEAELNHRIDKHIYKLKLPELRTRLLTIQRQLSQCNFPVIIVIAGVDGSGKGDIINLLNEWMDARYIATYAYDETSEEERERPVFWRYWRDLPPRGRIGIVVGAWYSNLISQTTLNQIEPTQLQKQLTQIQQFEQEHVDDGALIIKCWLHLSQSAQQQKIKSLEKSPETRWKVTKIDKKHLNYYPQFITAAETILTATSTKLAPWLIVAGNDGRYSSLTIGTHILNCISKHIEAKQLPIYQPKPIIKYHDLLAKLDLSQTLEEPEYKQQLNFYQRKIYRLTRLARQQKRSSILVFEGWDAAGKGGAIRRLTRANDARNYRVIAIAAPTEAERQHHYLWRFWRHLPRDGKITIYDRSWYGRVLVERVEQLATEAAWQQAYSEIVNFEQALIEHGMLIIKFWLHIDQDEQLRRFKEREQISYKQHKITAEDYRNRKQWPAYEIAVNDMVKQTSTTASPWILVAANDKKYARIKILKAYCQRLEQLISDSTSIS